MAEIADINDDPIARELLRLAKLLYSRSHITPADRALIVSAAELIAAERTATGGEEPRVRRDVAAMIRRQMQNPNLFPKSDIIPPEVQSLIHNMIRDFGETLAAAVELTPALNAIFSDQTAPAVPAPDKAERHPALDWTVSEEAKANIAAHDDNRRHAAATAHTIIVGASTEGEKTPKPQRYRYVGNIRPAGEGECEGPLPDGTAFVTFEDGSAELVSWKDLVPIAPARPAPDKAQEVAAKALVEEWYSDVGQHLSEAYREHLWAAVARGLAAAHASGREEGERAMREAAANALAQFAKIVAAGEDAEDNAWTVTECVSVVRALPIPSPPVFGTPTFYEWVQRRQPPPPGYTLRQDRFGIYATDANGRTLRYCLVCENPWVDA